MSKYNARKVLVTEDGTMFNPADIEKFNLDVAGIVFDSTMEGEFYQGLLQQKKAGHIRNITCHPKFVLQERPKIAYIADFLIEQSDGRQRVVDVKGVETAAFRIKKKLFQTKYPEHQLEVLTKYKGCWVPLEIVKKAKAESEKAKKKLIERAEQQRRKTHESKNRKSYLR